MEAEAEAVLRALAVRGIEVPEDAAARVRGCADQRQLQTWFDRAITVTSVAELFD